MLRVHEYMQSLCQSTVEEVSYRITTEINAMINSVSTPTRTTAEGDSLESTSVGCAEHGGAPGIIVGVAKCALDDGRDVGWSGIVAFDVSGLGSCVVGSANTTLQFTASVMLQFWN